MYVKQMRKKELTKQQLFSYSITQNDDKHLCFDFSRLDKKIFFPVLAGIEEFGLRNVESLTICLDLYYESCKREFPSLKPARGSKSNHSNRDIEPAILVESAFRQVPKVMNHIVSTVERIIRSTISLNTIEFKSIVFSDDQLEILSNAIMSNTTISTINFINVPVFDKGFQVLSRSFRRPGISEIKLQQCGLTDESIESVKSLLAYNVSVQRETEWYASLELDGAVSTICMKKLDLSGNLFTIALLSEISDSLADIPMTQLNLMENQPMSQRQVNAIRKTLPHINIKVNDGKSHHRKVVKKPKNDRPLDSTYIESIIRKNVSVKSGIPKTPKSSSGYSASLVFRQEKPKKKKKRAPKKKTDLPSFRFSDEVRVSTSGDTEGSGMIETEEVELAPGVVAVGKRAHDFAQFVQQLCNVAETMTERRRRCI